MVVLWQTSISTTCSAFVYLLNLATLPNPYAYWIKKRVCCHGDFILYFKVVKLFIDKFYVSYPA